MVARRPTYLSTAIRLGAPVLSRQSARRRLVQVRQSTTRWRIGLMDDERVPASGLASEEPSVRLRYSSRLSGIGMLLICSRYIGKHHARTAGVTAGAENRHPRNAGC